MHKYAKSASYSLFTFYMFHLFRRFDVSQNMKPYLDEAFIFHEHFIIFAGNDHNSNETNRNHFHDEIIDKIGRLNQLFSTIHNLSIYYVSLDINFSPVYKNTNGQKRRNLRADKKNFIQEKKQNKVFVLALIISKMCLVSS